MAVLHYRCASRSSVMRSGPKTLIAFSPAFTPDRASSTCPRYSARRLKLRQEAFAELLVDLRDQSGFRQDPLSLLLRASNRRRTRCEKAGGLGAVIGPPKAATTHVGHFGKLIKIARIWLQELGAVVERDGEGQVA